MLFIFGFGSHDVFICAHSDTKHRGTHGGAHTEERRSAEDSMHLSSRGEFGQDPSRAVGPKGLSGPPLPLLPLRIEVGWIRLPSANERKRKHKNLINKAE